MQIEFRCNLEIFVKDLTCFVKFKNNTVSKKLKQARGARILRFVFFHLYFQQIALPSSTIILQNLR